MQKEKPPQFNRINVPFLTSDSSDPNETPQQRERRELNDQFNDWANKRLGEIDARKKAIEDAKKAIDEIKERAGEIIDSIFPKKPEDDPDKK